jgi:DNA replication protein DnaC
MKGATDQEILEAGQKRLLEKRKEREATISPIRLMPSAQNSVFIPKCKHGNDYGECEDCSREFREEEAERVRQEEEKRAAAKAIEMKARSENPWEWLSGYSVPLKYKDASFSSFVGGQVAKKHCMTFPEKNVVLSGKTGCGKTHLAVSRLRDMVIHDEMPKGGRASNAWELPEPAVFITAPTLLMEIRDSFKDDSGKSEREIVDFYVDIPVMILDDLGADRATEWAIETLYLIIDGRDSNLKPTFITTNLTIPEIEKHYGARIASRIAGMNIMNIDLPDYRKKRG